MLVLAPPLNRSLAMNKVLVALPRPWNGARVGKCYNNVLEMIRREGGEACYGWALTDFGPHSTSGTRVPPLYRRWLNHVVWRDLDGQLWEVTPNAVIGNAAKMHFAATEFVPDPEATFDITTDEEWATLHSRYVAVRPAGVPVADLLRRAQHSTGDERTRLLQQALQAIQRAGFRAREWKIETIGERTGSIWLIAE
jgi:hypothetical protein